jgi:purine-binding chemotaxis protein CheW
MASLATANGPTCSYCTFRLGEGLFGLDVSLVREVSLLPPLTIIAHAPAAVRGYVNLRGQIHLVLDVRTLLGQGQTALSPDTRLVVLKPALGDPTGVLVDRVGDIVHLSAAEIEDRGPAEAVAAGGFVRGVGKLDGELLVILDALQFLPAVERALVA